LEGQQLGGVGNEMRQRFGWNVLIGISKKDAKPLLFSLGHEDGETFMTHNADRLSKNECLDQLIEFAQLD
jgi:hypothetical protein